MLIIYLMGGSPFLMWVVFHYVLRSRDVDIVIGVSVLASILVHVGSCLLNPNTAAEVIMWAVISFPLVFLYALASLTVAYLLYRVIFFYATGLNKPKPKETPSNLEPK